MIRVLLAAAFALMVVPARAQGEPRILALGGAVTETAYALGAGASLVGSDLTSRYPATAARLPKVGYLRALGAEGLLSLRPDLVLASADAGPPAVLRQVEAARVEVVSLAEAHSAEAALERVRRIGATLGRSSEAGQVADAMEADLAQVATDLRAVADRPRVLFLLSVGRGAPMAAGAGTAADAMLRLAGARNAVEDFNGYRPLSAEALLLAAPDVVLTTTQTLDGVGGAGGLRDAVPGLDAGTPVAAFDSLYLLGFGPRLAQALHDLAAALHPRATIRSLPARPWAG